MRCLLTGISVLAVVLIAAITIVYVAAPAEVRVERSIVINAPAAAIFPKVNNLKAWQSWSPWSLRDPDMKNTYEGPEAGVGAKVSWESETQGNGSQEITESVSNKKIATKLDFGDMGGANSDWTFAPEGDGTKVTWGMDNNPTNNPIGRVFNLFLDKMVGTDYEAGLATLKVQVEEGEK